MTAHVSKATLSPTWYIVKARPQAVMKAGEEVLSLGMTVYIPQRRKEYKHNRQNRWITRYFPILESYFFVLATEHWSRVLACDSVERILRSNGDQGVPIPISDDRVAKIRSEQETGQHDEMRVRGGGVAIGSQVKVSEGAFAGLRGTVEAAGDEELTILLSMLGRQVRTKAPIDILRGKE